MRRTTSTGNPTRPPHADRRTAPRPTRIFFVRPPSFFASREFPDGPKLSLPLGLLSVASVFDGDKSVECKLLDAPLHADLESLSRQRPPYFFGMSFEGIAAEALGFDPEIVAISSNFGFYAENAIETARAIRKGLPNCFVVVGGADATAQPERYLKEEAIDLVVLGEGEVTFRKFVDHWRREEDFWGLGLPLGFGGKQFRIKMGKHFRLKW